MIKSNKKSQKGILTVDFIFSIMAVYGISMVFAVLSLTLMLTEVGQYVAFATSRSHISGHVTELKQKEMAKKKFDQLNGKFHPMLSSSSNSWFLLEPYNDVQDLGKFDAAEAGGRQKKYGVILGFKSNLLKKIKLPFIGSLSEGAEDSFGAGKIKSYLHREPSSDECLKFNAKRWDTIQSFFKDLKPVSGSFGQQADNGC